MELRDSTVLLLGGAGLVVVGDHPARVQLLKFRARVAQPIQQHRVGVEGVAARAGHDDAVGGVLKSLHERGLIDVVGRAEGLGRPLLYGTTAQFLEHFALRHLEELPRADELAIALRVVGTPAAALPNAIE